MTEDQVIELAVAKGLGRTMRPIGLQTGDVFVTDEGYRTGELLEFSDALTASEREKVKLLATMLEDCAQRLEFVCGGGDDKVSTKYLRVADLILRNRDGACGCRLGECESKPHGCRMLEEIKPGSGEQ